MSPLYKAAMYNTYTGYGGVESLSTARGVGTWCVLEISGYVSHGRHLVSIDRSLNEHTIVDSSSLFFKLLNAPINSKGFKL